MSFSFKETNHPNMISYVFTGYIDEHAQLPNMTSAFPEVHIDLNEVKGINSIGTRNWCNWVNQFGAAQPIVLKNCPVIVVKTLNNILGACPPHLRVLSFYVPFISAKAKTRKDILFTHGTHFKNGDSITPPEVKDADGTKMEMDTLPSYFRFLKK